jgi:hypothetical protein
MTGRNARASARASAALLAAFVLAGCAGATGIGDDGPAGSAEGAARPSVDTIEQVAAAPDEVACTPGGAGDPVDHPAWPTGGDPEARIIPLLVSSLLSTGPNRLLYNVTDADYQVLAAPGIETSISVYALERDPDSPAATVPGSFLETPLGRGMYRASVDLDCAGEWGLEVTAHLADGSTATERMRFEVHASGTTPAVGQPAPRSDSPTATTVEELRLISTDPDPFPGAYERSVAEVVTAGQPSLVFFATPSFCQTGYCGPTVNLVKSVAIDYADRIGFVNVEPYELHMTENGLQPALDADGQLQPVQAVIDYGIPVEPYLFVVDAAGDVFAKFEGVVGEDELRASIEDALAQAEAGTRLDATAG